MGIATASLLFTLTDVGSIDDMYKRQVEEGRFSFVVTTGSANGVSAAGCDSLNAVAGVSAAGAVMSQSTSRVLSASRSIRVLAVSAGYAKIAWPDIPLGSSALNIAPPLLVAELGIPEGTELRVINKGSEATESIPITYAPAKSGRINGINDALVRVVAPTGRVSQCLISAVPASYAEVGVALRGWFGPKTLITDYLTNANTQPNTQELFERRVSNFSWIAASLLLIALFNISWFAKRNDFSLYRVLGLKERHLAMMLIVETIVVVIVPIQFGTLFALLLSGHSGTLAVHALLADWLRILIVMAAAPAVGIALIPRRSSINFIKGR
jgi:hypothetical protein